MIFRVQYEREGRLRCMTFAAANDALAADFAYTILQTYIAALGGSWVFQVLPCSGRGSASRAL